MAAVDQAPYGAVTGVRWSSWSPLYDHSLRFALLCWSIASICRIDMKIYSVLGYLLIWNTSIFALPWVIFLSAIRANGYCPRSIRPSVGLERRYRSNFKDFNYRPEIWWDDAQYHEAVCYLKWPCLVNFCMFHGTLKFSMIGLDQEDNWNLVTWCNVPWNGSLFEMATPS